MVVDSCFEDIFDLLSSTTNLTLPKYKPQCLDLEFHNEKGSNIVYEPGDTIGVIPHNSETDVEQLLSLLDLPNSDNAYSISADKGTKIPLHIPVKSTLRHVLKHCVDLRSIVKKLYLLELSQHTSEEREKKALQYLCSTEGSAIYTQHVLNRKLTFTQILAKFKSCKPPIGVILAHSSRLLPRPYSIVNCIKNNENFIKICFSVNTNKGLTTGWLESLISNDLEIAMKKLSLNNDGKIPIYLRKNCGFLLPRNGEKCLLIGPGTGVAPFIGFLQENLHNKTNYPNFKIGDIWLYNGCRNPDIDFLYKKELEGFLSNKILTKLRTAFSRVENGGIKHVQDAILQDAAEIVGFIQNGGLVYICGDYVSMATQVRAALVKCFMVEEQISQKEAECIITQMEKDKKYNVDIWS